MVSAHRRGGAGFVRDAGEAAAPAETGLEVVGAEPLAAGAAPGEQGPDHLGLLAAHEAIPQRWRAASPVVPTDQPMTAQDSPPSRAAATRPSRWYWSSEILATTD